MRSVGGRRDDEGMDERERGRVEFEGRRWASHGRREAAIRDTFDESVTTYCQRLDELIMRDDALREMPVEVGRLRRLREARQAARRGRPTA